jgi:hypothetical protein
MGFLVGPSEFESRMAVWLWWACSVCDIAGMAPHDSRNTCARLCLQAGERDGANRVLLGHVQRPDDGTSLGMHAAAKELPE